MPPGGIRIHNLIRRVQPSPQWAMAFSFTRFLDHTQRPTTVGRTPVDEWSARRRDLYLTTHNTHDRQTYPRPPNGIRTHNLRRWVQPSLQWARTSSFTRFLDHTQRRSTVGRTPMDEWSARRKDLYLTTHDTQNIKKKSMPSVGFEATRRTVADLRLSPRGHRDRKTSSFTQ